MFRREYAQGRWGYTSLAAPSLGVQQMEGVPLFEPFGMSAVAFGDGVGSADGEEGRRVTSLVGPPGGPYVKLHEDAPVHGRNEALVNTQVVGASRDLGHVVLESGHTALCAGGERVKHGEVLCEWSGGELQLVNVKPGMNRSRRANAVRFSETGWMLSFPATRMMRFLEMARGCSSLRRTQAKKRSSKVGLLERHEGKRGRSEERAAVVCAD